VTEIATLSSFIKQATSADSNCSVFKGSSKHYVFGLIEVISHTEGELDCENNFCYSRMTIKVCKRTLLVLHIKSIELLHIGQHAGLVAEIPVSYTTNLKNLKINQSCA